MRINREELAQASPAEVPGLVIDQLALELTCGRVLLLAVCDLPTETRTELAHCLQLVDDQLSHARDLVTPAAPAGVAEGLVPGTLAYAQRQAAEYGDLEDAATEDGL